MKPAVINVDLAWGAACDLVLLVQDAAGVPLDLSGAALDFALKAGDASVPLAVDAADAAEGLVRVRVPGQDLGMFPWEGWLQTSPETPRERILRGLMTVTDKVDPRAEGNPSTHRYFVRLSDAVTVSVDSVDLAWWAYAHALKAQESMESLADAWPETVSEAKQDVHAVKEDALAAIRDKQADAVLAVGRAQKTATDKIAGAQADAVSAVQEAEEEAQGTITPLVQRAETAKEAIDQAEGRINTAATNAANSATSAGNSATAAANALAAIPQVDAEGNMTLAGNITVMSASINGPFVAGRPDGTVSAGTCNQIYGITRFWQSLDVRSGGWWRGTMMYETGMLNIAQGASLNCIGPATFASTLNANGGVNIPLAVGAPTATGVVNRLLMGVFEAIPRFLVNGFKTGIMVLDILTDAEFWQNVGLAFLNVMQAAIAGIAALLSKLVAKIMDLIPGLEEQARWMHGLSDDARRRASVGVDNVGNAGQRLIDAYGDRILGRISDDFSALQDAFSSGFSEAADVLDTSGVRAEISAASEKITASLAAQDKERAAKEKEDASKSKPRRQKTEDDTPKIKVNWETVLAGSLAKVGGGGYGRMMLSAENVPQKQLAEQKKTNELLNKLLQKQNGSLAILG